MTQENVKSQGNVYNKNTDINANTTLDLYDTGRQLNVSGAAVVNEEAHSGLYLQQRGGIGVASAYVDPATRMPPPDVGGQEDILGIALNGIERYTGKVQAS